MAPTIVTKAGAPFLALGSPGGATIITTVLQILLDRVDLGLSLPQAIADPRASQRNALNTGAEPGFLTVPERAALEARGHHRDAKRPGRRTAPPRALPRPRPNGVLGTATTCRESSSDESSGRLAPRRGTVAEPLRDLKPPSPGPAFGNVP